MTPKSSLARTKRVGPSASPIGGTHTRNFNPNLRLSFFNAQRQRPPSNNPLSTPRFILQPFKMTHESVWYSRPRK